MNPKFIYIIDDNYESKVKPILSYVQRCSKQVGQTLVAYGPNSAHAAPGKRTADAKEFYDYVVRQLIALFTSDEKKLDAAFAHDEEKLAELKAVYADTINVVPDLFIIDFHFMVGELTRYTDKLKWDGVRIFNELSKNNHLNRIPVVFLTSDPGYLEKRRTFLMGRNALLPKGVFEAEESKDLYTTTSIVLKNYPRVKLPPIQFGVHDTSLCTAIRASLGI